MNANARPRLAAPAHERKDMNTRPIAHSVNGACDAIGCGKTKLYDYIAEGRLDARKMGSKTIITDESLVRLIDELPRADITGQGQGAVAR